MEYAHVLFWFLLIRIVIKSTPDLLIDVTLTSSTSVYVTPFYKR